MDYTKGKWEVRKRLGNPKLKYCVECPKQEQVEIICNTKYGTNACLISAAPDLYEALKFALKYVRMPDSTEYEVGSVEAFCLQLNKATAAIAKAEGKI